MRLASVADLHGHLGLSTPECDVLAVCGDIVPLWSTPENWKHWQEYDWMKRKFMRWLARQPADRILITYGNHDLVGYAPDTREKMREKLESDRRVTVLDDRNPSVTHRSTVFAGYSFTSTIQSRSWAFSLPRTSESWQYTLDLLPADTDVLLTHGPPQGLLDECDNGRQGSAHLMHWLLTHGPALTLCGHIHEARGKRERYYDIRGRECRIGNVSIMNESYSPKGGRVQVFDI